MKAKTTKVPWRPCVIILFLGFAAGCGKQSDKELSKNKPLAPNKKTYAVRPGRIEIKNTFYTVDFGKKPSGDGSYVVFKIKAKEVQKEIKVTRKSLEPLGALKFEFTETIPESFTDSIYELVDFWVTPGRAYTYTLGFKNTSGAEKSFSNFVIIPGKKR
jgi:hypothetical protein